MNRRVLAKDVLLIIALGGCATTGDRLLDLQTGKGRIVVFRESGPTAMFAGPSIYVNGKELGKLYQGTYLAEVVEPGQYEVRSEGNFFNWPGAARVMPLQIEANSTTYLQLKVIPGGGPAIVNHQYIKHLDAAEVVSQLKRATLDK